MNLKTKLKNLKFYVLNKIFSVFKKKETSPPFDPIFYLKMYPDVAAAGIDPLTHFKTHGLKEGRIGNAAQLGVISPRHKINSDKKTILIVSHDASLSGAPMVSLCLVEKLINKYNVIVLLLGTGALTPAFCATGATVVYCPLRTVKSSPFLEALLPSLLQEYTFKYALVNSIGSAAVLPIFKKCNIPTISLFHEFSSAFPQGLFLNAIADSTEAVFSSQITYDDACSLYPNNKPQNFHIIPQGRCVIPPCLINTADFETEKDRIKSIIRPSNSSNIFVVMGAGNIEFRKGVDLFIKCAAYLKNERPNLAFRFIWIGKNENSITCKDYFKSLIEQIDTADLKGYVEIIPPSFAIQSAYKLADLFLLTSRADPLPNVTIDALQEGLPVLCFNKTTGIAEFLVEMNAATYCIADHLDAHDMARKVAFLADSPGLRQTLAAQLKEAAINKFDMNNYAQSLDRLASNAALKTTLK